MARQVQNLDNTLNILSFALGSASAGEALIRERELQVDVVSIEGITLIRAQCVRVDPQTRETAVVSGLLSRTGIGQRADRSDAPGVRA